MNKTTYMVFFHFNNHAKGGFNDYLFTHHDLEIVIRQIYNHSKSINAKHCKYNIVDLCNERHINLLYNDRNSTDDIPKNLTLDFIEKSWKKWGGINFQ
jgi:hypothetical protein